MAEQEPLTGSDFVVAKALAYAIVLFEQLPDQYEAGENKEMAQLMQAELDKRASPDQQERLLDFARTDLLGLINKSKTTRTAGEKDPDL